MTLKIVRKARKRFKQLRKAKVKLAVRKTSSGRTSTRRAR